MPGIPPLLCHRQAEHRYAWTGGRGRAIVSQPTSRRGPDLLPLLITSREYLSQFFKLHLLTLKCFVSEVQVSFQLHGLCIDAV